MDLTGIFTSKVTLFLLSTNEKFTWSLDIVEGGAVTIIITRIGYAQVNTLLAFLNKYKLKIVLTRNAKPIVNIIVGC